MEFLTAVEEQLVLYRAEPGDLSDERLAERIWRRTHGNVLAIVELLADSSRSRSSRPSSAPACGLTRREPAGRRVAAEGVRDPRMNMWEPPKRGTPGGTGTGDQGTTLARWDDSRQPGMWW